jgi:predicted phage baseplate assembly protein
VALANVVIADHGASVPREQLVDDIADERRAFSPRLMRTGIAFAVPVERPPDDHSASAMLATDPGDARAQVWVDDGQRAWSAVPDLIGSGSLSPEFVVEPETEGVARLRFGNGVNGREAASRDSFGAVYRLGGGRDGDVGSDRLDSWLARPDGTPAVTGDAKMRVWNPLPAVGGTDPEDVEKVRALAPTAYRKQLRAVTTLDYATTAEEVTGVQRAVARRRWTGSWYAEEVLIDPRTQWAADPALPARVTDLLEIRRMAGVDVEVRRPVYIPLLIAITGCVNLGYERTDVEQAITDVLSSRTLAAGELGFFHPDRFTFGQPLYLSDLVAAVMGVPGVSWAEVDTFGRLSDTQSTSEANLALGRISIGEREVLRCDSDPNNPENGRVEIALEGG